MYLSKAVLHWPNCRNPYQWHRLIWSLFDRPDDARDYQFACINRREGWNINIILFSLKKPDRLKADGITCIEEPKNIREIMFKPGQQLKFRLTANPTKKVTEKTEEKRKLRVPLIKPEQRESWFKRHLEGCAEIISYNAQNEAPLYFNRNGIAGKIVPVLFEGILKVANPEKFHEQIYEKYETKPDGTKGRYVAGIGPAKAFGCGLMLVRKI